MNTMNEIVIGSRGSALALVQANWVAEEIKRHNPSISTRVEVIKTTGDKILDVPLAKIGSKGLFVKEIETALLEARVDLAVHSMKDLPTEIPEGLCIAAVPARVEQCDVLVSAHAGLAGLPTGAKVGSSSLRRRAQLKASRPDLNIVDLRGNLDTRLKKLDSGEYDAIILACAGLRRLGLAARITEKLPFDVCLPAVGQGALAIEARSGDSRVLEILRPLDDSDSRTCVEAERAMLAALGGGCQTPIGAAATIDGQGLHLVGLVSNPEGKVILRREARGLAQDPESLGKLVAQSLLKAGADEILRAVELNVEQTQMGAA